MSVLYCIIGAFGTSSPTNQNTTGMIYPFKHVKCTPGFILFRFVVKSRGVFNHILPCYLIGNHVVASTSVK